MPVRYGGVGGVRVIAVLVCLAFAVLATLSGLDRQSARNPGLARFVPRWIATQSLVAQAEKANAESRTGDVVRLGRAAVDAAPLNPASTALLGAGRLASGDAPGAEAAFLMAGQMGWRNSLTQAYWLARALELEDYPVAAMRLDALLRQHPWMLERSPLPALVDATPDGRAALLARLASRPPWLEAYASQQFGVAPAVTLQRATVLAEAARNGITVGCDAIAPMVKAQVGFGQLASALSLWRQHCPSAGGGLLTDPGFAALRPEGARTMFEWDLVGSADLGMVVTRIGGRNAVEAHSSASFSRIMLRQAVVLVPGSYRLTWTALGSDGKPSDRIRPAFACVNEAPETLPMGRDGGTPTMAATLQANGECAMQWLIFWIAPGDDDITLSNVALTPL